MNTQHHNLEVSPHPNVADPLDDSVAPPVVDVAVQRKELMYKRIAELKGPSPQQIIAWKESAPGNRVRAFSLDNVRFYIVRAIGGLELAGLQKNIPANSSDPEREIHIEASSLCTLWTSTTRDGRLSQLALRTGTAGLPRSIWTLIETLSDYADPQDFQQCSIEL